MEHAYKVMELQKNPPHTRLPNESKKKLPNIFCEIESEKGESVWWRKNHVHPYLMDIG